MPPFINCSLAIINASGNSGSGQPYSGAASSGQPYGGVTPKYEYQ
jgi:hypothetical protein